MTALALSDLEPGVAHGESIRKHVTVSEIVETFESAERDIRAGFALVAAATDRIRETLGMSDCSLMVQDRYRRVDFAEPNDAICEVRRQVWRQLVDHLELQRIKSIRAWEELTTQLRDGEPPEINTETVSGMLRHLHSQIPDMLSEAVREVFEWLRPGAWRNTYKTNKRYEIGPKVVLDHIVERHFQSATPSVHYSVREKLIALERVFQALDGQGMVHKHHQSELETALRAAPFGERVETRYFAARAYRKGTLHIEFRRLDLLKKLNQIAGGKRLRGSEGA